MTDPEQTPEEITDATVVEEHEGAPMQEAPSTQLAVRERRSEVLRPLDPEQVLESFETYQRLLQRILTPKDWHGNPNAEGSFVKKRGWRKIATAFDLDVSLIPGTLKVERDADGKPLRAEAIARAVAPSGRAMDGDGYCSADEPRFNSAKGRQKIENDLRATATTRAKNRAISDLVGLGDVSAEEVESQETSVGPIASVGPPYGPPASPEQVVNARKAIGFLLGEEPDGNPVGWVLDEIEKAAVPSSGGEPYLPHFALSSVVRVASKVKARREAIGPTSAPEPVSETVTPMVDDATGETAEEMAEREEAERLAAEHGDLS